MTDAEKVKLIKKIIVDFWEFNSDEDMRNGAAVITTAICSVAEFGEEPNDIKMRSNEVC